MCVEEASPVATLVCPFFEVCRRDCKALARAFSWLLTNCAKFYAISARFRNAGMATGSPHPTLTKICPSCESMPSDTWGVLDSMTRGDVIVVLPCANDSSVCDRRENVTAMIQCYASE